MANNNKDFSSLDELKEIWAKEEREATISSFLSATRAEMQKGFDQITIDLLKEFYSVSKQVEIPTKSSKKP